MARSSPATRHGDGYSESLHSHDQGFVIILLLVTSLIIAIVIMAAYDVTAPHRERRQIEADNIAATIRALITAQTSTSGTLSITDSAAVKSKTVAFISSVELREGSIWLAEAEGKFLHFPDNPNLVGKPLSVFKGPDGEAFYQKLANATKQSGMVSDELMMPTGEMNQFKNVGLNVYYIEPWDWIMGITLPEFNATPFFNQFVMKYGTALGLLVLVLIVPIVGLRQRVRHTLSHIHNIFRAVAYAQPLPPQPFARTKDAFGRVAKAYDLLLEADDARASGLNRVQDARKHPLVTSVIDATLVIDQLAGDLLEASRRISEVDYDHTLFVLDEALSRIGQAEKTVSSTIDQTRALDGHINEPLLMIEDRVHENALAIQAVDELQKLDETLDQIIETLHVTAVRANIDALGSVWTAMKDQTPRISPEAQDNQTPKRLKSFSEDLRAITDHVDSSIKSLKPKLAVSVEALDGYDDLILLCETRFKTLRDDLNSIAESLIKVVEHYNAMGETLLQVKTQVAKLRISPSDTSGAGFARDTLAIAERAQQARLDIERVLRFGKR